LCDKIHLTPEHLERIQDKKSINQSQIRADNNINDKHLFSNQYQ